MRFLAVTAVIGGSISVLGASEMQDGFRQTVAAGGYVYVSTLRPRDVSESTTITSQTADVLSQLKQALEASGSSLGQLCSVSVSLKSASDFAAMNDAYRAVFTDAPPARTTIVSWMRGNAKIEITAVAVPNGAHRETLQPSRWTKNPRPYSYIVRTDDLVFFSGLISRRGADDAPVSGSVRTQMTTILDNAGTLLDTAGLTFDDVVAARVYLTSPYDFEEMNNVYGQTFVRNWPARATAVVDLMSVDSSVEVTLIASRQPKRVIGQAAGLPVSAAVEAGPRVWLSGVIGDTDKHAGNTLEQTRDIFSRMSVTLKQAGLSLADVIDTTVYLRDSSEWPKVDTVFHELFPANPPARNATTARLVVEPGLVEVLLTAIRR